MEIRCFHKRRRAKYAWTSDAVVVVSLVACLTDCWVWRCRVFWHDVLIGIWYDVICDGIHAGASKKNMSSFIQNFSFSSSNLSLEFIFCRQCFDKKHGYIIRGLVFAKKTREMGNDSVTWWKTFGSTSITTDWIGWNLKVSKIIYLQFMHGGNTRRLVDLWFNMNFQGVW